MMTTLIFLQTFLFSSLPFLTVGFNNTLAIAAETAVITASADSVRPREKIIIPAEGKVIKERENAKDAFRIKTVVIDAGHGGHDPGCLGADSQEKHLALAISQALAEGMKERFTDLRIILTRDKDVFVPLHERAAIANRAGADLFISIHCNYMPNSEATHGSETYIMGLHTADHNLDVAKRENAVILLEDNYEKNYDYDPNSPEGHIMLSMYQNAYLEHSILFAERVEAKIHEDAQRRSRGVKQAGFVVLKETAMPSVLIETGFLSNRAEEKYLKTTEGQQQMARAIIKAFEEYRLLVESVAATEEIAEETASAGASTAPEGTTPNPVLQDPFQPAVGDLGTTPIHSTPPASKEKKTGQSVPPPAPEVRNDYALGTDAHRQPAAVATTTPKKAPAKSVEQRMTGDVHIRGNQPVNPAASPKAVSISRPAESVVETGSIHFCVQLAASPRPLNTSGSHWQNTEYLIEVIQEQSLYKYQVRAFPTLREAMTARFALRSNGFTDAFIVAYKGKQRISLEEARRELER